MGIDDYELDRWFAALMRRIGRGVPTSRQDVVMTLRECEKALEEASDAPPLTEEEIDQLIERVTGKKQE